MRYGIILLCHPLTVHEQEVNSQYTLTVHYNSGIKTNFGFISNGKLSICRYFVVIVGKVLTVLNCVLLI